MENFLNLSLDLGVVLGGLQGGKLLSRQRKVEKGREGFEGRKGKS